jgi:hypothetical protein
MVIVERQLEAFVGALVEWWEELSFDSYLVMEWSSNGEAPLLAG